MKLREQQPGTNGSGKKISDVLGEEVNQSTVQETQAGKNEDDFTLDPEEATTEKQPEQSSPTQPEQALKEDTKKVTEKKELIAPDGTKTVQTVVTETTELNAVKARAVKPNMMLLMWDMFVPKLGGAIYPDTDKNHWKLDPADKGDLTVLITESANEGDWKGVPTKIFLMIALAAIILIKWRSRNEKLTAEKNTGETSLEQTKAKMLAEEEEKGKFAKYEEQLEKMQKQNEFLQAQLKELQNKKGTFYEEISPEEIKKAEEKIVNDTKEILKEAQYKGYDLEKIRFSVNGGFAEREKAGQQGYNKKGVKIGTPSAELKDVFEKWKQHHSSKGSEIPYFVA